MNRNEVIQATAESSGLTSREVEKVIDAFVDVIAESLRSVERIEVRSDFGSFVVREKGGESSRGSAIKTQRVVSFKATPSLKKRLRQSDQDFESPLREKSTPAQPLHVQSK